jgi:hypothetical protein
MGFSATVENLFLVSWLLILPKLGVLLEGDCAGEREPDSSYMLSPQALEIVPWKCSCVKPIGKSRMQFINQLVANAKVEITFMIEISLIVVPHSDVLVSPLDTL